MNGVAVISELALDPGFGSAIGRGVGAIALYAVVGLVLMVVGFYAIDFTTPGKLSGLVRAGAPNAVIVTSAGLVSMALIVVVAIYNAAGKLDEGLLTALIFGFAGIVVQVLAVRLLEWVTRLDIGSLIESDRFAPASVVVASAHVALGLVVAVAIS
ncbi:DUF350 domain-containing protein [Saccharothrix algeriensis]|uniref:DUF350 domain-containing protein n=1 Tax=Saccharothrix algeriensis TaxID=173560 RepID=A0A8T8I4G2_9PSEU|nr:DUF350 domain-containing protein [Saccharothrix algeriensis]QTR05725.1 DUF350 domain-containing protein [Saccharothrix algeriensis]